MLDDLDPQACRALLADPSAGWFEPSAFGTGERRVHLFRAGALLCAGDRAAAETSYRQALGFEWAFAVEQPLHSRVCNMWDAVTRMFDPKPGPCALEEVVIDGGTEAEDDEAVDDPPSQSGSTESTDTGEPADTDDPSDTDEPTVTSESTDALSEDDSAP